MLTGNSKRWKQSRGPTTSNPTHFQQGRSPASFLIIGCRGHPCPRRCGTHGGFHIKSFLRSYLLLRRDARTPLHERSHVDLERPRTLRLIDQVHYLVANGGGRDEVRRIHV